MKKLITFILLTVLVNSSFATRLHYSEKQKLWGLAGSSILTESNYYSHQTLAMQPMSMFNIDKDKELLKSWWGISDRKSLLDALSGLDKGGHRNSFETICIVVNGASVDDLKKLEETCEDDFGKFKTVISYHKELKGKGILGWDYSRYIYLCRSGYLCGYLTEFEAWSRIMEKAKALQSTFDSWEDLGKNYIVGYEFWQGEVNADGGSDKVYAFQRLVTKRDSPWKILDWNLDLTPTEATK